MFPLRFVFQHLIGRIDHFELILKGFVIRCLVWVILLGQLVICLLDFTILAPGGHTYGLVEILFLIVAHPKATCRATVEPIESLFLA